VLAFKNAYVSHLPTTYTHTHRPLLLPIHAIHASLSLSLSPWLSLVRLQGCPFTLSMDHSFEL
jgi:hypothetical protein